MIERKNIKAILFDSGGVLNYPRTGNWFIPPNFSLIVDLNKFKALDYSLVEKAFMEGMRYLNSEKYVLTELEEFILFKEFYRIISKELKGFELTEIQITELAKDTVYNDEKFLFPEHAFEIIPALSKKYKLGVVSDTWPSLERVFRNKGLRDYFSSFVMSSVLGVSKPHGLMFNTALSELKVKPEETLFIDNNVSNLHGAKKLGLQTALMCSEKEYSTNLEYLCIHNLHELQEILM